MADTAVEIFLENLERLISCSGFDFILHEKVQLQFLHDELRFLTGFFTNSEEKQDEHSEVKNLIRDVAYKAETIVDWFVADGFKHKDLILADKLGHALDLGEVRQEIRTIKIELEKIYAKRMHEVETLEDVAGSTSGGSSRQRQINVAKLEEKMVVGFDGEATGIIQELDDWRQKHLSIISIVGAGGAGKTTLASKVYHDRLIRNRFPIRGWIVVSQEYDTKDLLIAILKSTSLIEDGDFQLSCDKLGEQLHRRLRDKKYLVVIDDIWSVEAWIDIQRSFPDDLRGSRVIFTTRLSVVAAIAQHHHDLRPLSPGDSWELLQRRLFGEKGCCPSELVQIGMEVAEKCRGLPLAIVVIAGILEETLTLPLWKRVARSLSSIIATNDEVCMNTLALSYNHLPLHLKACFLYLGAFPENKEISVRKLILLWIAEGFVKQHIGGQTLEAIAEGYLMDLAGRSLVMVAQKSPGGGIEACRIHDLLRELCLRKGTEEYFFGPRMTTYSLHGANIKAESRHRRLQCINGQSDIHIANIAPNLRTFLCLGSDYSHKCGFSYNLNLLSVLDLSLSPRKCFPAKVVNFVHLRYLAISISASTRRSTIRLPPSISNLWNLETLILYTEPYEHVTVNFPEMGNTTRLRHILLLGSRFRGSSAGRIHFENPCKPFSSWDNLQTLYGLCPCEGCLTFLRTTRNLKTLGICWDDGICCDDGGLIFRDMPFSEQLEELKLCGTWGYKILLNQTFPLSIRKLTLKYTYLEWEDMTILGRLPCLEVLKLLLDAFVKGIWNTNDDEFCRLKYLELDDVDVLEWNSCADHFPNLETLVLRYLKEIKMFPYDFGELTCLEKIVVHKCDLDVEDFARQIQEEHHNYHGDYRLEVLIKKRTREHVLKIVDFIGDEAKEQKAQRRAFSMFHNFRTIYKEKKRRLVESFDPMAVVEDALLIEQKARKAVSSVQGVESIAIIDMKKKTMSVIVADEGDESIRAVLHELRKEWPNVELQTDEPASPPMTLEKCCEMLCIPIELIFYTCLCMAGLVASAWQAPANPEGGRTGRAGGLRRRKYRRAVAFTF